MDVLSVNHVGFWVSADGFEDMLTFLTEVLGLRLLSRDSRGFMGGGERAFVQAGDGLRFEVLTTSDTQPRPDVPVHPKGNVVGIPHICLTVRDLPSWDARLSASGYPATRRLPEDLSFADYLGTRMRALWFTGPSGIGFEMFEFDR